MSLEQHLKKPKILIIYAATGGGHLSAAKAIDSAIQQRYPNQYDVEILNAPVACGSSRVQALYGSYNMMLKADPGYAKHGLKLLNSLNPEKMLMPLIPKAYQNLLNTLMREKPDIIVSVHGIVNYAFIHALKDLGWYNRVPYVIVCTDLTENFLKGWANPEAQLLLTSSELAKEQLREYGVPSFKIKVHNGFPVGPEFFKDTRSKKECREALNLAPDRFTILLSMGGMAVPRSTYAIVHELQKCDLPIQLMVVCGMNRSLKERMDRVAQKSSIPMHVFGFTNQISQMMTAADLMISKPGPGTIMEAIIKELPMLIDGVKEPMPQEKGNLEFVLKNEVGLKISHYREIPELIERLVTDPREYTWMQENMRKIKNEDAIFQIADSILELIPKSAPASEK